jgi:hypothetical protein
MEISIINNGFFPFHFQDLLPHFGHTNTNAINKVTIYGGRLGRPNGDVILINALILDEKEPLFFNK